MGIKEKPQQGTLEVANPEAKWSEEGYLVCWFVFPGAWVRVRAFPDNSGCGDLEFRDLSSSRSLGGSGNSSNYLDATTEVPASRLFPPLL